MNTRQVISGLFIILLLSLSGTAFSQGAPKPIYGAKAGINLADVGGDIDNQMKIAGHAGVYSEIFFDYFLMMQVELLLSFVGHGGTNSLNLTYLTLPIVGRYNLGYNFNVHAGLQPGFLLSAKQVSGSSSFDVKDQFKGFDLGLPIGVGWEFADRKYNVTLRYIIGLMNVDSSGFGIRRNNVLQASFGILLHQGI
jgi:hypothetical protein